MTYVASEDFSPIVLSAIAEAKIVASHVIALKPKSMDVDNAFLKIAGVFAEKIKRYWP
jgi:hypothetical protein